jgi:hypothetical protein
MVSLARSLMDKRFAGCLFCRLGPWNFCHIQPAIDDAAVEAAKRARRVTLPKFSMACVEPHENASTRDKVIEA